jgi:hypothetical protein
MTGEQGDPHLASPVRLESSEQGKNEEGATSIPKIWASIRNMIPRLVEESHPGQMRAYSFKFGSSDLGRGADSFTRSYRTEVHLINQDNYLDFLQGK